MPHRQERMLRASRALFVATGVLFIVVLSADFLMNVWRPFLLVAFGGMLLGAVSAGLAGWLRYRSDPVFDFRARAAETAAQDASETD